MNKKILNTITNYNGEVEKIELFPIYDNAKSFYKKATVKTFYNNGIIYQLLYSYNTLVIVNTKNIETQKERYFINHDITEELLFSNTTLRHIKEFLKQYNTTVKSYTQNEAIHKNITKKDILESEGVALWKNYL